MQANFLLHAENIERAVNFYVENFGMKFIGEVKATEPDHQWAALKLENANIWLGRDGATMGLILMVENDLDELLSQLREKGVHFFLPTQFKEERREREMIIISDWGRHAYFFDSERNVVMLFEPVEG